MANNATNTNVDWPAHASGLRNGNSNHLGDTDVSYLLRGDASGHHSRSQYGIINEYHPVPNQVGHNLHPGLHTTGLSTEEQFWPQQNGTSNNTTPPQSEHVQNGAPHDENARQDISNDAPSDQDVPPTTGPARRQRTTTSRSERRKHYKPKPDPSHPRLFRPFAPHESKNTMLAQWRTPQIIGSHVMFPNKQLKYNPVPPDLDEVREKLFKMDESVLLKNSQEVADYVPHITNYWRSIQKVEVDEETGVQYEHWYCRSKKARKPAESVSKGIRNKTKNSVVMHEGKDTCKMRIRVTSFTKHAKTSEDHERWGGGACRCVAEWVHFERDCVDGDPTEHAHDQVAMDEWKHSEAIAVFAKIKCEEGNGYSAVVKWLRKELGDVNKQVYQLDKGDVANAAKPWRNDHKDLVLREEVPEDSDEAITMRRCVDAIFEANAGSLRAALREICKDSDALTNVVLEALEKNKPAVPAEEQPQEPWRLTEGVTLLDLPPPGVSRKVQRDAGVKGPLLNPHGYANSVRRGPPEPGRAESHPRMGDSRMPLGPDGRPIVSSQVMPPRRPLVPDGRPIVSSQVMPARVPLGPDGRPIVSSQISRMVHSPNQAANGPNSHPHAQPQDQFPALKPRPPMSAYGFQPPTRVEIRHIQPPAGPPQRGALHPITISMEVPSCPVETCNQCKHMNRGVAGRTFFFQDKLHTPTHFTKLERLLRDPKQLLDNDYTRLLHQSQTPTVHQHPALHPRPVGGRAVGGVDVMPQVQRGGLASASNVTHAGQSPHIMELQRLSQSIREALPDAQGDPGVSSDESGESLQPTPQPATTSIYDMALPIATNVDHGDDDDDDDSAAAEDDDEDEQQEQPPAKRQRLESAGS